MQFCWTTLHVQDMEASLKFYQEVVRLPLNRRFAAGPGREIAFLGEDATQVELVYDAQAHAKGRVNPPADENANSGAPSPAHPSTYSGGAGAGPSVSLGFRVADLDAQLREVAAQGIAVHSGPHQPNPAIRFFYVADPDGLLVQFVEEKSA